MLTSKRILLYDILFEPLSTGDEYAQMVTELEYVRVWRKYFGLRII